MSDVSEDALALARYNANLNGVKGIKVIKSYGLNDIEECKFSKILANPPYHVDFSVPKNYIEKGYNKLAIGGKLYLVTKRREWYKRKLISVFGGVKISELNGYYIFIAEKRNENRDVERKRMKNHLSKKLYRKYEKKV